MILRPHPWQASAANHTIVAGGILLQEQAKELGYTGPRVLNTGGMVVHPAYYQRRERRVSQTPTPMRNRLNRRLPTAVLFFGGFGPLFMEKIAEQLLRQVLSWAPTFTIRAPLPRRTNDHTCCN